jgi:hypothetical protein
MIVMIFSIIIMKSVEFTHLIESSIEIILKNDIELVHIKIMVVRK